jgi:hypothetical protein
VIALSGCRRLATLEYVDDKGRAVRLTRLFFFLLVALTTSAVQSGADLKAVFAFNDRVFSIRFPEFNYGIATTVNDNSRQIAVTFPSLASAGGEEATALHVELSLEALPAGTSGQDYYQHYLTKYSEDMRTIPVPDTRLMTLSLSLLDCRMTLLSFKDAKLRLHKALLITSIDVGMGVVILLDGLQDVYDANEETALAVLESIRFEN